VPPDELSPRAKIKFQQIAAEAFWLDELSVDLLAAYVHAWDRWLDCVAMMDETQEVIVNDGKMKQNPYRQPLRTYVAMMEELSGKLGLGNIDRLKLSLPATEKKEEDPFENFMAKVE
jgi:P27 family predicted phage terminase small subunit